MTNTSLTSRPGNGLARSEIPLADLIHVSEKEEPPSSGFQACSNGQTISPSQYSGIEMMEDFKDD